MNVCAVQFCLGFTTITKQEKDGNSNRFFA